MSGAYATVLVVALPIQARAVRLRLTDFSREFSQSRRELRRSYRRSARTMSIWSVGMFMIAGLDGVIVGRLDFGRTGVFVLSATLATILIGGASAWQPAFLALASRRAGRGETVAARRVSRLGLSMNLVLVTCACGPAWLLLGRLVPQQDLRVGYGTFVILAGALALRQYAAPVVLSAVADGRFDGLVLPALVEGGTNLFLSVVLCAWIGALGVALGTLIGALVSMVAVLRHTFTRPAWAHIDNSGFGREVLATPTLLLGPPLVVVACLPLWLPSYVATPIQLLGALLVAILALRLLDESERLRLGHLLHEVRGYVRDRPRWRHDVPISGGRPS